MTVTIVQHRTNTGRVSAHARMNCGVFYPTSIPNTASGPGDYDTILKYDPYYGLIYDTHGGIADLANNRMNIIAGYKWCRASFSVSFAGNATGWRGCRIKNSSGGNYGNQRILAVAADATTNSQYKTPWIEIVEAGGSAPNSITVGDWLALYPAQTSGGALNAGVDRASSWFILEFSN